jgi:aldehyde:ferredoxin oxidoreductase
MKYREDSMGWGGYAGKILYVNLDGGGTAPFSRTEPLEERILRRLIGGRGYGAYLLYRLTGPSVQPFDPANPLILSTGPLTGTPLAGSKFVSITKSPLTGLFLDSYSGGEIAGEIKYAGYDHIVIQGRAVRPSYLFVEDGMIEVRDASHLWGKTTLEAEEALKKELGSQAKILVTGPAGENLVPFSCICTDYYHQSGRGGAGAVMGSKNLKAVAVKGSGGITLSDSAGLRRFRQYLMGKFRKSQYGELRVKYGTAYTTVSVSSIGVLPTRNFQQGTFEGIENINCFTLKEKIWESDHGCLGCQAPCMNYVRARKGKVRLVGPEYETISLLGSNVGVDDIERIAEFNELCDAYGVDTISCGNVIAFAMECYEKGLIGKSTTEGIDLRFGNADAVAIMIAKIAKREGFGNLLADGVKRAAERIGKGSAHFAIQVKGMEISGYEPRGAFPMGLAYATATRGGCHRRAKPVEIPRDRFRYDNFGSEGNAAMVKKLQDAREPVHCGILCDALLRFCFETDLKDVAEMYRLVVGWEDISPQELSELAERIYTLTRCYNVREGIRRKDDNLPPRILYDPLPDGPGKGKVIGDKTLNRMLDEYYDLRGWDRKSGIPTPETLKRLDLTDIIGDLGPDGEGGRG